jgi:peptidyl-dipeptidase A
MNWHLAPASVGFVLFCGFFASMSTPNLAMAGPDSANDARAFINEHERTVRPLERAAALAWWNANVTGRDIDFKAKEDAQNRLDAALSDHSRFDTLKSIKAAKLGDPQLARQIEVLYLIYLEKQVDPELLKQITAKANVIDKAFNAYRAVVNGREMTDSEVRKVLKESRDSNLRKAVWEGSKGVGSVVEPDLKALVKLRNETAHKLGFADYHKLQLFLNEQTQDQVLKLFDELDLLTREPFRKVKLELDASLAEQCGLTIADLRPWHYHDPFFQEAPAIYAADFDSVYAKADILKLCRDFYAGIGLPIYTKSPARARMRFAPTSIATATCGCWPTSCPTSTGWAPCSTSLGTRFIAAGIFRAAFPMCCEAKRIS